MAESTPGNLGGMFGGWVAGRAAGGNRRLDQSVDRLEATVTKLADVLERLGGSLSGKTNGGGGATQQSATARPNGGGSTFGGAPSHMGASPGFFGTIANAGYSGMLGAHEGGQRSSGDPSWDPRSTGGAHSNGGGVSWGGMAAKAGKGIGGAAVAAGAIYTANHYSNQQIGSTIAMQYAGGPNWSQAYRSGLMNNFSAASDADAWQTGNMLGAQSGYLMGSSGYNAQRGMVQSISATNPTISNVASAQGTLALGSVGTFNKMRGMGINVLGAGGKVDPRSVARQLLAKMGSTRVKTPEQVAAAFGPAGSATVTVNAYVAQGMMPAETAPIVLSEMRNILQAQVSGMSYGVYNTLATTAGSSSPTSPEGKMARAALQESGIAANTLVQQERGRLGLSRESEGKTIEGFVTGVSTATTALNKFRDTLNSILGLPGIGQGVGLVSGATGTMPILGGLLGKIPGGGMISGIASGLSDGPPSLSAASASFGGATGLLRGGDGPTSLSAGAASFGGAAARGAMSGGASSGSARSASSYSLGPVKPWVQKAAEFLGPMFGIKTIGGYRSSSSVSNSDHPKGLACDFMCATSQGNRLAPYAVANHKKLNISYVIWRQRIWSINHTSWQGMEDRGSPTDNHMDHVHISFLASPTNKDFSGMPGGALGGMGGGGGGAGNGMGGAESTNGSFGGAAGADGGAGLYSEVAALGLGGGGGGGGFGPSSSGSGGSGGGGAGGIGSYSQGGAGHVNIGSYNMLFKTSMNQSRADLSKIMGKVDVLGTQEDREKYGAMSKFFNKKGWSSYHAPNSDTSLAWDSDKYAALQKGSRKMPGSLTGRGITLDRAAPYVLLRDKETGAKFWVMNSHDQAHLSRGAAFGAQQRAQFNVLRDLYGELSKSGLPVFQVGDFNNTRVGAAGGKDAIGRGIDHVLYNPNDAHKTGGGRAGGYNSDHPFVYASFNIGGGGGGGQGGSPAQNMQLGRAMAARYGWGGNQWNSLKQLWMHESGWRTNADNPTSSAYGIPQGLTAMHGLGQNYMQNPDVQIKWGLNYIKDRYGSPANAWNFWQKNHWYSAGEWNVRDDQDARVHKGEMILPSKIADVLRDELAAPGIRGALGGGRGGSGMQVTFERGSIQVNFPGGNVTRRKAEQAGQWVVDAMMEDRRMKTLAEG